MKQLMHLLQTVVKTEDIFRLKLAVPVRIDYRFPIRKILCFFLGGGRGSFSQILLTGIEEMQKSCKGNMDVDHGS